MDGYNNGFNNNYSQPEYQPTMEGYKAAPVKCPGKEIAGLVLGINALVWSVLGTLCGCIPVYGIILASVWNLFGIGFGIAANVLHKKVHEQATEITDKIEKGKKLGTIGIIVGIAGIVLAVVVLIVLVFVVGISAIGSSSSNGGFSF